MVTRAQRKKAREQRYVQAFLRNSGLVAKVLDDNREAPDFLLEIEGRPVGLEVTQVFAAEDHPRASTKANEVAVDEIIERAKQAYEARGGKVLRVTLSFNLRADVRSVRRTEAAQAISVFLSNADPKEGRTEYDRRTAGFDRLPQALRSIAAFYEPSFTFSHWGTPRSGWVSPTNTAALQPHVDDKAMKVARYRQVVPEVWLLLVIDGHAPSQFLEPSPHPPAVASPFDRNYLYYGFSGEVQLLPAAPDAREDVGCLEHAGSQARPQMRRRLTVE